jgi:hypothetical protein
MYLPRASAWRASSAVEATHEDRGRHGFDSRSHYFRLRDALEASPQSYPTPLPYSSSAFVPLVQEVSHHSRRCLRALDYSMLSSVFRLPLAMHQHYIWTSLKKHIIKFASVMPSFLLLHREYHIITATSRSHHSALSTSTRPALIQVDLLHFLGGRFLATIELFHIQGEI